MRIMRYQKVIRHGTSLAVVIPAAVCREVAIHRGDVVELEVLQGSHEGGSASFLYLVITPVVEGRSPTKAHGTS